MVTSSRSGKELLIVAKPDHSCTWRHNVLVLLALALPSLGVAIMFSLAGAWPILPLAGLELTALGIALYVVNRKLQYRHVITLSADTLTLDKGFHAPQRHWHFARGTAGLSIAPEAHPWSGPDLILHDRCEHVSLGEFLSREDTLQLIELLRPEIRVRSNSVRTNVHF